MFWLFVWLALNISAALQSWIFYPNFNLGVLANYNERYAAGYYWINIGWYCINLLFPAGPIVYWFCREQERRKEIGRKIAEELSK